MWIAYRTLTEKLYGRNFPKSLKAAPDFLFPRITPPLAGSSTDGLQLWELNRELWRNLRTSPSCVYSGGKVLVCSRLKPLLSGSTPQDKVVRLGTAREQWPGIFMQSRPRRNIPAGSNGHL